MSNELYEATTFVDGEKPPYTKLNQISTRTNSSFQLIANGFLGLAGREGVLADLDDDALKVVASSTPDMNVTINTGVAVCQGTLVQCETATVKTIVAPTVSNRYTIIQIDSDGNIETKNSAEAANPVEDDPDAGFIKLAAIYLPLGVTTIANSNLGDGYILDRRNILTGMVRDVRGFDASPDGDTTTTGSITTGTVTLTLASGATFLAGHGIVIEGATLDDSDTANTADTDVDMTTTGGNADDEWIARKFTADNTGRVGAVSITLGKTGSPAGTSEMYIFSDNGYDPSMPLAQIGGASDSVTNTALSADAGGATQEFIWSADYPPIVAATDYWLVMKTTGYTYANGVTEIRWRVDANGAVGLHECAGYDANRSSGYSDATNTEDTNQDMSTTGNADDLEWVARKFTAADSGLVEEIAGIFGKTGAPAGSIEAYIFSDDGGAPSMPNAQVGGASDSVNAANLSANAGGDTQAWSWDTNERPEIVSGTAYWVVWKTTGYTYVDAATEIRWRTDANGEIGANECAKYESDGAPWTTMGADVGADLTVTLGTWTTQGADVGANFDVGVELLTDILSISGVTATVSDNATRTVTAVPVSHDETVALQAGLTALSADGGILYFPQGVYLISDTLDVYSNTIIRGAGRGAIIRAAENFGDIPLIQNEETAPGNDAARDIGIVIENIKIDGNVSNNTSGVNASHCISLISAVRSVIRNCWLYQPKGDAVRITGVGAVYPESNMLSHNFIEINGDFSGIRVDDASDIILDHNKLVGSGTGASNGWGIYLDGTTTMSIVESNRVETFTVGLYVAATATINTIANNILDGNGTLVSDQSNALLPHISNADVSTSGVGEDDLATLTVPANSLSGLRGLTVLAAGAKTGGNDNKTIKFHLGATSITVNAAANDTEDWRVEVNIYNTATNAQRVSWVRYGETAMVQGYDTMAEDTTGALTLKFTGECANIGDTITQTMMVVEGRGW